MLQITIPAAEYYNDQLGVFVETKEQVLQLEHSLLSISKWEATWCKPFLGQGQKTVEECADYVRCMTLTQNVSPLTYASLTQGILDQVNRYIEAPMTATWFNERPGGPKSKEIITSEIIYYWMVALNIPFECQKWHLNRLLALVRVCNIKNAPQKKMGKKELMRRNRALNEARRQRMGSNG